MPELGPYGSMRGEVRENLPYRDRWTKKPSDKIKGLQIQQVRPITDRGYAPPCFGMLRRMRALGDRLDVHTRHAASRVTGGLPAMLRAA